MPQMLMLAEIYCEILRKKPEDRLLSKQPSKYSIKEGEIYQAHGLFLGNTVAQCFQFTPREHNMWLGAALPN